MNTHIATAILRSQTNSSEDKIALVRKIRIGVKGPTYKAQLNTKVYTKKSNHSQHWIHKLLNKIKAVMPSRNRASALSLPEYGASNYLADDFYEIFGLNIGSDSTILSKGNGIPSRSKKNASQSIPLFI